MYSQAGAPVRPATLIGAWPEGVAEAENGNSLMVPVGLSFRNHAFGDGTLAHLVPVSHFWDQSEPRLFVCEAVRDVTGTQLQPVDRKAHAKDSAGPTVLRSRISV